VVGVILSCVDAHGGGRLRRARGGWVELVQEVEHTASWGAVDLDRRTIGEGHAKLEDDRGLATKRYWYLG